MTAAEIAAQLALFVAPDQVTELRALNVGQRGRTFAGWFSGDRLTDLARNALALTRQATGVYFVPNPIDPDLAAKRLNKVLDVHKGFGLTTDSDVLERRFLVVDLDPRRVWREATYTTDGDQDAPTASRELGIAYWVARHHVIPYTRALGAPDPVAMLSGNGIHLVYPIDPLPGGRAGPDDPLAVLLRDVSARYGSPLVSIDPATYTAARMLKVPGTLARKGTPTAARPFRLARIVKVPNGWQQPRPVGRAATARVADPAPVRVAGEGPGKRPADVVPGGRPAGQQRKRPEPAPRLFDGGDRAAVH